MDLGLKDKVVICMSSASGFGKGIATEMAREGAKVVICTSEAFRAELEQTLPGRTDAAQAAEARELGEILNRFLRDLTPEKRKIFLRRYWYLDSIAAIAEGYGISRSKVKVTLYRCREQLRQRLESEGYRP